MVYLFAVFYLILIVYHQSDSLPHRETSNAFLWQAFLLFLLVLTLFSSNLIYGIIHILGDMEWIKGYTYMGECSRKALRYAFPLSMLIPPCLLFVPESGCGKIHLGFTNFLPLPGYFSSTIKSRLPSMQIGRTSSKRVRMNLFALRILLCDKRKSLESSFADVSCINRAMYPIRRRVMQRFFGGCIGGWLLHISSKEDSINRASQSATPYRTTCGGIYYGKMSTFYPLHSLIA